jgi:hypothetical protein
MRDRRPRHPACRKCSCGLQFLLTLYVGSFEPATIHVWTCDRVIVTIARHLPDRAPSTQDIKPQFSIAFSIALQRRKRMRYRHPRPSR